MVRAMQINSYGLDLIKRFEGFRGEAYLCPAGVWTIGYGHTSMAGPPPVRKGQKMSRAEATKVLKADVEDFADGVRSALKRDINDNQFSALVSFAFNVGLGAFRSSSVLKAVNRGDFEAVPRRLNLWVKAGPRVLPGLVKRRAAEGELFMTPEANALFRAALPFVTELEVEAMDEARALIEPMAGKEWTQSTTVAGALAGGIAGLVGWVKPILEQWQEVAMYLPPRWAAASVGVVIVAAATYWIVSERLKKSRDDAL